MQKGYIEGSNRVNREAILYAYFYTDIREASALTEEWNEEYSDRRLRETLQN